MFIETQLGSMGSLRDHRGVSCNAHAGWPKLRDVVRPPVEVAISSLRHASLKAGRDGPLRAAIESQKLPSVLGLVRPSDTETYTTLVILQFRQKRVLLTGWGYGGDIGKVCF